MCLLVGSSGEINAASVLELVNNVVELLAEVLVELARGSSGLYLLSFVGESSRGSVGLATDRITSVFSCSEGVANRLSRRFKSTKTATSRPHALLHLSRTVSTHLTPLSDIMNRHISNLCKRHFKYPLQILSVQDLFTLQINVSFQEQVKLPLTDISHSEVFHHEVLEHRLGHVSTLAVVLEEQHVKDHIDVVKFRIREVLYDFANNLLLDFCGVRDGLSLFAEEFLGILHVDLQAQLTRGLA